jgi:hypothetical protein
MEGIWALISDAYPYARGPRAQGTRSIGDELISGKHALSSHFRQMSLDRVSECTAGDWLARISVAAGRDALVVSVLESACRQHDNPPGIAHRTKQGRCFIAVDFRHLCFHDDQIEGSSALPRGEGPLKRDAPIVCDFHFQPHALKHAGNGRSTIGTVGGDQDTSMHPGCLPAYRFADSLCSARSHIYQCRRHEELRFHFGRINCGPPGNRPYAPATT